MLLLLGDSLFDSGNLRFDPYAALTRASDPTDPKAYVLGEQLGYELGLIQLDYTTPSQFSKDIDLGRVEGDNPGFRDPIVNYATISATTGVYGSDSTYGPFADDPYGLASQVGLLLEDLKDPAFSEAYEDADVILNGGNNDVFQFINTNLPNGVIPGALASPACRDYKVLIDGITGQIVGNLRSAIKSIRKEVDDIVVLGLPSLEKTPLLQQVAQSLGQLGPAFTSFVAEIVAEVNDDLIHAYNKKPKKNYDKYSDVRQDIYVIDGAEVFDQLSSVPGFGFFDGVHPNSFTNALFAQSITQEIEKRFVDFGHG